MGDYNKDGHPDLFFFLTNNGTATGVYVIDGANLGTTFLLAINSTLESFTDGRFDLSLGSYNNDNSTLDLFAIKKSSTGSGKIEVHVLSASSSYQTFVIHMATELPADPLPTFRTVNWPASFSQLGSAIVRSTVFATNVPARVTVLTSQNNFNLPFYSPVAVIGRNGMFVDIDGDGALDYVSSDPTNDSQTWSWYRGTQFDHSKARPSLLQSVTTPLGAVTAIRYASSAEFQTVAMSGAVRNIVVQTTVSGPGLTPLNTEFTYQGPQVGTLWYQPWRVEQLGFFNSYIVDDATNNVHQFLWGNSHAYAGMLTFRSIGVLTGTGFYTPFAPNGPYPLPTYNIFDVLTSKLQVRPLLGAACQAQPDGSSSISGTNYPVIVYDADDEHSISEGPATLQSSKLTGCVDTAGNMLSTTYLPDTGDHSTGQFATAQFTETRVFPSVGSVLSCVSCVLEVYGTNTSVGAPSVGLYHRYYRYDGYARGIITTGHLNFVEQLVSGSGSTGVYEIASTTTYNGNGTVASISRSYPGQDVTTVTDTMTYDPNVGLEVVQASESDSVTTLIKTFTIDPQYGLLNSVTGPYLSGGSALPVTAYAYDKYNRLTSTGFQGKTTRAVSYVAWSYGSAVPASTIASSFATASTAFPPTSIPTTDDVNQAVSYYDGLGRNVQTRVRLGTGGSPANGAQITQDLGAQYLVGMAVVLDGAGRTAATLDPFYTASASFVDYHFAASELATAGLHVRRIGYDSRSRAVCSTYGVATNPLVQAPVTRTACTSNFTPGSASYARATFVSYGTDSSLTGRSYLTVDAQPDWENTTAQNPWTPGRQYLDAAGRTLYVRDQYQNFQQVTRDVLGRDLALTRFAGPLGASTSVIDAKTYDFKGRLIKEADGSRTRLFTYLPTGEQLSVMQNPTSNVPTGQSGVVYKYGSLGRLETISNDVWSNSSGSWVETVTPTSKLHYDTPYPGAAYSFTPLTAGRLSYVTSHMNFDAGAPDDVIAFATGFDGSNWWNQRNQWFTDLGYNQVVTKEMRNDGALLNISVQPGSSSPHNFNTVSYSYRYDSAGRPVAIDDGGSSPGPNHYWEARAYQGASGTGNYDSLGRLTSSFMDNGRVQMGAQYDSSSNLTTGYWDSTVATAYGTGVKPSAPNIFWATNMSYVGTKLTSYGETQSSFAMAYDREGRLTTASATSGSGGPLSQAFSEQNSFFIGDTAGTVGSWPNNTTQASLWNLQFVNGLGGSRTYGFDSGHTEEATSFSAPVDSFVYDANGLLTTHTPATGSVVQFIYDAQNRLSQVNSAGLMEEQISYDATGALARRQFPSGSDTASTFYAGADLSLVVKSNGSAIARVHVLLGGQRVATIWQNSGGTQGVMYYHRDRLGSVIETSTAGGILGVGYRYDVYGKLTNTTGTLTDATTSDLGYTGALKLSEGLVYLNARTYDSGLRRFLQPDNVDARRYMYAGGDPINLVDPSGHRATMMEHYMCRNCGGGWAFVASAGDVPWGFANAVDTWTDDMMANDPGAAGGSSWQDASGATMFGPDGMWAALSESQYDHAHSGELGYTSRIRYAAPEELGIVGGVLVRVIVGAEVFAGLSVTALFAGGAIQTGGNVLATVQLGLWEIVQNEVGAVYAAVGLAAGASIVVGHGGFEIQNHPLQALLGGEGSGITFGVFMNEASGSEAGIGAHEGAHVIQSVALGPLYLPLTGISLLLGTLIDNGDSHGPHSFMETGPQADPPRPFP